MIIPVVLSGGSGTRLWPMSTPDRPKQFLSLLTDRTLFQETLLRLNGLPGLADPIVVCNEAHRFLVAEQLREIGLTARAIVLEPEGRNTAPAIAVAAMMARESLQGTSSSASDSNPALLVLPADHVIADRPAFHAAVSSAVRAADEGRLVTFGIVPTHAETGYGYIEQGAQAGDIRAVERFVEKPDAPTAERYLEAGHFLWNSGMFVFSAGTLLTELEGVAPEILSACQQAVSGKVHETDFTRLGPAFLDSPSDSIDYALMEKTSKAVVVPLDAGWSDVGSWGALFDVLERDAANNALIGRQFTRDCLGCCVISSSRPVAAIGLRDIVVVETDKAVLVIDRSQTQSVKDASSALED